MKSELTESEKNVVGRVNLEILNRQMIEKAKFQRKFQALWVVATLLTSSLMGFTAVYGLWRTGDTPESAIDRHVYLIFGCALGLELISALIWMIWKKLEKIESLLQAKLDA